MSQGQVSNHGRGEPEIRRAETTTKVVRVLLSIAWLLALGDKRQLLRLFFED
ncbi:hypothetical protein [Paraburkholderia agricolaris]|uniref:hypothetical protein n=1 Tax=Paraburkholderia agricolaris TaxID=2152888 RepID=UPI00129299F6|nr:hypothetical protein [Paraburkholderia agricolaris]